MIDVHSLTKVFPGGFEAVANVSFRVEPGRTLAIIGPSGCGKTTTLKMLNRLYTPTQGRIRILGKDILDQDPIAVRRRIGYVIQRGGLFPHWTVQQNIGLVPSLLDWSKSAIEERVAQLLELLGLDHGRHAGRYPGELSGGEQQRVGIARALAADPPVMLMDEPFSALDPITRQQLQCEFIRLKEALNKTIVLVTHDLTEAFLLADHVLLMKEGQAQQLGTPQQLKSQPANAFVKEFLEGWQEQ